MTDQSAADMTQVAQSLADQKRLVAVGWNVFRANVIPENASANQIDAMKRAFYTGALHMFDGLQTLADGKDPLKTQRRLAGIAAELEMFHRDLELQAAPIAGNA